MNWNLLKINKCPQCEKDLWSNIKAEPMATQKGLILIHKCGFKIRESKYKLLVSAQITQALEDQILAEKQYGEIY